MEGKEDRYIVELHASSTCFRSEAHRGFFYFDYLCQGIGLPHGCKEGLSIFSIGQKKSSRITPERHGVCFRTSCLDDERCL